MMKMTFLFLSSDLTLGLIKVKYVVANHLFHARVQYEHFRKDFYNECEQINSKTVERFVLE